MLESVIRFSLTQRLFVGIFSLTLVALGYKAWLELPVDAFPDISPTQVKIILKAPGMTAEEIESQVTRLIETELLGIPNQKMLRSTTKYAIADITLDFIEGTDIYWARQQVNERLANVRDELPKDISGGVAPMSTPLSEMFMFTIENPDMSLLQRRQLLDWHIRPILRTVEGVADVNVLGGYAKTYSIAPDPYLMASAEINFADIENSINQSNLNAGLGRIQKGNDILIIRAEGRINNIDELQQLVIKNVDNKVIRLKDIAQISIGHLPRYGAVTKDGIETTQALIIGLKNANASQVVEGVKKKIELITPTLPQGTSINIFYDRASLIDTAIQTISDALILAVILVVILLSVFLGNYRSAIAVSISLPLAALCTFLMMSKIGLTANLMSLGGIVIAIGMIVDSSVVVVENIVNQLARSSTLPRLHIIFRATKEVAVPVISGTLIVIIVFSPLLTLSGLEGKLFTPVALTIVFAMFSALFLSLTLVPMFSSLLLNRSASNEPKLVKWLQQKYLSSLKPVLANPPKYIISSAGILLLSLIIFTQIGKTFMPTLDEGDIIVQLEKSPSISLESSIALDNQIELALLEKIPEIKQIVARTGSDEIGLDPMSLNETDVFMELKPMDEWRFDSKEELKESIRQVVSKFPGINFGFTQPIQMRVSEMLTGSSGDVSIKIFGEELSILASLANEINDLVREVEGSVDVQTSITEGGQFVNIQLRQEMALQYQLTIEEFSDVMKSQLEGMIISEMIQGKKRTPIVFSVPINSEEKISTIKDLQNRVLIMPDKSLAPLSYIADISYKQGPLLISREQGARFSVVTTNVEGRDVVGFVESLRAEMAKKIDLPSGYSIDFGGEFENQQRATKNLLTVIPVALGLILIILFTTFRSLAKAGLVLANIPFAVMGGVIALFVSGEYLSVPASVGFIALLGVAVLNGVVMLSYFEQTRFTVEDLYTRIVDGSVRRLRPVLMTATTAMFGLLPLVFATGPGAEIQKPLAIVVIGGLFTSTITTLYLLPLFYRFVEKRHAEQ